MSRINTNIASMQAMHRLHRNNAALSTSLQRLSTGLKINSGKDAPAALIASETLRSEINGINQAIENSARANNVINTAEGSLSEVAALLLEIQSLTNQAANKGALSSEEVAANQLQVDSILQSINRIANTTQFNGFKLLNGTLDYTTAGAGLSNISNLRVHSARLPDSASVNVVATVTQSAQVAEVTYLGSPLAATSATTIQVSGLRGMEQISIAGGAALSAVTAAIDSVAQSTGVDAVLSGGTVYLKSLDYGAKAFVTLKTIKGTASAALDATDAGRDAAVSINGAEALVDGLAVQYRAGNLDLEFDLKTAINTTNGSASFQITGGGARFQLGPKVTEADKASIGIQSMSTGSLGDSVIGYLSTIGSGGANALGKDNLVSSQRIIDKAIKQVSQLRGRLGAFQKEVLESNINSLSVTLENVTASESAIRDTDFAAETAAMTRAQILVQATTAVLSQANATPQTVLTLLGR